MNASKNVVEMFTRMLNGDKLSMDDEMQRYNCSAKTIQRYLRDIRESIADTDLKLTYIHDLKTKTYYIKKETDIPLEEVLALLKVIIGIRAFGKTELNQLTKQLLGKLSKEDSHLAKRLINSTASKYVPVKSNYDLLPRIKNFSEYIDTHTAIEFTYLNSSQKIKTGIELPLSIYFDNFYFYVTAYNEKLNQIQIHRMDRFQSIVPLYNKKIPLPWSMKKDDGNEINNTYLISDGKQDNFQIYYSGFPQTALDHFPNSKVIKEFDNEVLIEGTAYTQGLIMWIMGQGTRVRVKSPVSLIEAVKSELKKTLEFYG